MDLQNIRHQGMNSQIAYSMCYSVCSGANHLTLERGRLEDFSVVNFFFPTDQKGIYFFQSKSSAIIFLGDFPQREFFFFFTPIRS